MTVVARNAAGPLLGARIEAVASHPVGTAPDVALAFRADGNGRYLAQTPLPAGRWLVQFVIRSGRGEMRLIETVS